MDSRSCLCTMRKPHVCVCVCVRVRVCVCCVCVRECKSYLVVDHVRPLLPYGLDGLEMSTSPSTLTLSTSHIAAMNTPVRDMPSLTE